MKKTVKVFFAFLLGAMALISHAVAQPVLVTNAPAAGTFYLLSVHPSLPFPFDPYFGALPVYSYDGVFFVDDSQVGDLQMQQNGFGGEMMSSSLSGPGEGGSTNSGPLTNICSGPMNFTVTYQLSTTNTPPYGTTDLWLEIQIDTNNLANLSIHTPNTNSFYDVFGTTNLSPHVLQLNQTNWMWLQRALGASTNFLWTNITCEKWFRLGTMLDEDLDGLTSASEELVTHTNPKNGDTDHDGLGDRDELLQSRNPLVGDSPSPIIYVTSPTNSLTAQKWIQLDGYCTQRLSRISYWVYTNGAVSDSGMGYVTNQTYNMTSRQFTTNFFRCYDLPLAVGVNTIVLQAVDALNNTNSLSVNYTVDFSVDTNAPVFTLQWPTNGMAVSGNSFTMNGTVNNPSASVKVSVASTNETADFYGIVSGSGRNEFWVPDVTLPAGTSTVTMVVSSPGGLSSTSSVSLVKNIDAELTIQPGSYAINEFNHDLPANVSGYIRGSGYSVSLNGRSGTTSYNSEMDITYWSVTNVPGNEDGWMELVATAVPSGSGAPITAKYEFEKLPLLRLKEYHFDTTVTVVGPQLEVEPHHEEQHYKRKEGGYYTGTKLWTDSGCNLHWEWTPDDELTNYSKICATSTNLSGCCIAPPSFTGELTEEYQEVEDGDDFYTYTRSLKQERELRAGGKPYPGRKDLGIFSVSAAEHDYLFNNDVNLPFFSTNLGTVAASATKLFGKSPNPDGKIPALVVPSSIISIAPLVAVQNKGVNLSVPTQAKLQIVTQGHGIAGLMKNPTWIGKGLVLTAQLTSEIAAITNYEWTVAGDVIGGWNESTSPYYLKAEKFAFTNNTNATVTFFPVEANDNLEVKCLVRLNNGMSLEAKTSFEVRKPSIGLSAQVTGPITNDTVNQIVRFGAPGHPGITFTIPQTSVDLKGLEAFVPSWTSNVFFWQEGTSFAQWQNPAGTECKTETGSGLDNAAPRATWTYPDNTMTQTNAATGLVTTNLVTNDSPSFGATSFSRATVGHRLKMHAVFTAKPPSIPIALKRIEWSWSATLTNGGGFAFVYPTNISAIDETLVPIWTNNIRLKVSTTNNTPCP
jgi:hypothetical protein